MTTEVQAQQQTQTIQWMNEMDEVSSGSSNFLKFAADEDEKILKIVKDPVKGVSKFPYADGSPKPEFKIEVMDGNNTDIKTWAVTNRSVMQQILAICKKEGMSSLAGSTLRATATGNGKDRRWFIRLLQKPAVNQAAPVPAPIPVSDADREASFQARQAAAQATPQAQAQAQADPGQDWIEQQRAAAEKAGVR